MGELIIRRTLLNYETRLDKLKFCQGYTTDFTTSNYPQPFRIKQVSTARTVIGYTDGNITIPVVSGTNPNVYPIPLQSTSKITVTANVSFELDVMKITDGVWKVYQGWWWLTSGSSVNVSDYTNQDYYFIILVQNRSATKDNVTIILE